MRCTKNPNKRVHDLNDIQTATTGFFQHFFNDSIFIFHARRKNSKTKLSGDI